MNLPAQCDASMEKNQSSKYYLGFSLIELLVALGIMLVLVSASVPLGARFLTQTAHTTTVDQVVSFLRTAQSYAQTNKQPGNWGVCRVNEQTLRLYSGSCATPEYELLYELPSSVSLTGSESISFTTPRGEPISAGSFTIDSAITQTIVTVNRAGGIFAD